MSIQIGHGSFLRRISFGFNTALGFTIEMLDKARQAAQSARKVAVVEVLEQQAGWLALQAGIAVCADAVLIPEIPAELQYVAASSNWLSNFDGPIKASSSDRFNAPE